MNKEEHSLPEGVSSDELLVFISTRHGGVKSVVKQYIRETAINAITTNMTLSEIVSVISELGPEYEKWISELPLSELCTALNYAHKPRTNKLSKGTAQNEIQKLLAYKPWMTVSELSKASGIKAPSIRQVLNKFSDLFKSRLAPGNSKTKQYALK